MKKSSILKQYDFDKKKITTLHKFSGVIEAPNWLKDGETILYNADGRIWKYNIPSDEYKQLDTGNCTDCNNDHTPSPDNKELAISNFTGGMEKGESEIYRLPIEGGEPVRITEESPSYLHGWSNDGKELAFCAFREDKVDIYSIPADGGEEKKLTDGKGYNDGPEYSPDDKHIWFNSTREGLMQVFRMDRDGRNIEQMTDDQESNNWFPHVSPDGKKVLYLAFKKGDLKPEEHLPDKNVSLWVMDYDGSHKEKVIDLFGGQGTVNVNSWSPDSKKFAYIEYAYDD